MSSESEHSIQPIINLTKNKITNSEKNLQLFTDIKNYTFTNVQDEINKLKKVITDHNSNNIITDKFTLYKLWYSLYFNVYLDDYKTRIELLWVLTRDIDNIVKKISLDTKNNEPNYWDSLLFKCYKDIVEICPEYAELYRIKLKEEDIKNIDNLLHNYTFMLVLHKTPKDTLNNYIQNLEKDILENKIKLINYNI